MPQDCWQLAEIVNFKSPSQDYIYTMRLKVARAMPFEMRDEMVAVFIVDRLQKPKERALESAITRHVILNLIQDPS